MIVAPPVFLASGDMYNAPTTEEHKFRVQSNHHIIAV